MTRSKALQGLAVSVTLAIGISTASAAPPVPTFTITSGNVTMSASGTSIPFTLTSVDGFSGSLAIQVSQPTVPAGVRLPYLELGGPAIAIPLVENLTVTGSIGVLASTPSVVPVRFNPPPGIAAQRSGPSPARSFSDSACAEEESKPRSSSSQPSF
jgi:hypothetical protein